jgi:chemotaxis protein methyltransferase CheR
MEYTPRGVRSSIAMPVLGKRTTVDKVEAMPSDVNLLAQDVLPEGELSEILNQAHRLDIACYSESFVARSFARRWQSIPGMTRAGYLQLLGQDRGEAQTFMQSLDIHHSEFFRDPLVFSVLEHRLLPSLAKAKEASDYPEIRVWSAGCAAGEEAYSVAILLSELCDHRDVPVRFRLFATDSSAEQLELACVGAYRAQVLGNVQRRHLERWFSRQEEACVVVPELRERVDFSLHGLLDEHSVSPSASIFGGFDLILCCNVLIYYRPECQMRMLDRLRRCLAPGGYLVTGEAEREIVQAAGFQPLSLPAAIFQTVR